MTSKSDRSCIAMSDMDFVWQHGRSHVQANDRQATEEERLLLETVRTVVRRDDEVEGWWYRFLQIAPSHRERTQAGVAAAILIQEGGVATARGYGSKVWYRVTAELSDSARKLLTLCWPTERHFMSLEHECDFALRRTVRAVLDDPLWAEAGRDPRGQEIIWQHSEALCALMLQISALGLRSSVFRGRLFDALPTLQDRIPLALAAALLPLESVGCPRAMTVEVVKPLLPRLRATRRAFLDANWPTRWHFDLAAAMTPEQRTRLVEQTLDDTYLEASGSPCTGASERATPIAEDQLRIGYTPTATRRVAPSPMRQAELWPSETLPVCTDRMNVTTE